MLGCEEFRHVKHQYLSTYCDKKFRKTFVSIFNSENQTFFSWGTLNSKKFVTLFDSLLRNVLLSLQDLLIWSQWSLRQPKLSRLERDFWDKIDYSNKGVGVKAF